MAHTLDWLAVFILAFMAVLAAIGSAWPPDSAALATGLIDRYGPGGGFAIVAGLVLLTLTSVPALSWLVLRLLFVGQYRLVKAGSLLLCGIGVFVLTRTGATALPFLPLFEVAVLLLFVTTRSGPASD